VISIEECKKILNKEGHKYSDENIKEIRNYLYFIGLIEIENNKN